MKGRMELYREDMMREREMQSEGMKEGELERGRERERERDVSEWRGEEESKDFYWV